MEKRENILNKFKWWLYSLKIAVFKPSNKEKKETTMSAKRKEGIFLFLFLLFPMVQFLIFYVALNLNSILLAFKTYNKIDGTFSFAAFTNFVDVIRDIFVTKKLMIAVKNSAIQAALSLFIMLPINIITAYVVFKKVPFAGFLKIILFMPNLLSSMVFVINARVLIHNAFPIIFNDPSMNLLFGEKTAFWTVLLFGAWMSFAGGLVIYLSAMCSISQDVLEYGELEPLSSFRELVSIIIPMIFPTVITYIVVGIGNFFINQGYFFAFFGGNANQYTSYDTLGYVFFTKVAGDEATYSQYTYAAAGGILFTLIVAPITVMTKSLLEKYGPSED